jgi:zinc protease
VRRPYLTRSYLAPPRRPGDQREAAALRVLADLLGGSDTTSVMGRALQRSEQLALSTGASYGELGLDLQTFNLYVTPREGVSLAEAEARLDALIARFLDEGPDPRQLERLRTRIRAAETYALDSQMGRARRVGAALATGLTLEDVEAWPGLLQTVTAEEITAAARAVFRPEASVTGWLLPDAPAQGLGQ